MNNLLPQTNPYKGFTDLCDWYQKNSDDPGMDISWANQEYRTFADYVSAVIGTATVCPYDKTEQREDYLDWIQSKDKARKTAHDAVISACNYFNRECVKRDLPRFCPEIPQTPEGEIDYDNINRELIGEFASYVTVFTFNEKAGLPSNDKTRIMLNNLMRNTHLTPIQDDVVTHHQDYEIEP